MFTMTDEKSAIVCLWVEELDAALATVHDMGLPVAAPPVVLQGGSQTTGLPAWLEDLHNPGQLTCGYASGHHAAGMVPVSVLASIPFVATLRVSPAGAGGGLRPL